MKKIIIPIGIVLIMVTCLSGCTEETFSGEGVVTDKWTSTVKAGFGSRDAHFFEIDDDFYLEVSRLDYRNYEINDTYAWTDKVKNPKYEMEGRQ